LTYWISISGGKGSAISAILAHENGLDYQMVFADTQGEHSTTYAYIIDLSVKLGKRIHWLQDGRDIWDVFIDEKFIGNSRIAPCSKLLKTRPVLQFLKENAAEDDPIVLGMDWSELDRIERAQKVWAPRPVVSLINQFKCQRPDWDKILSKYFSYEPELYKHGFPHNNCAGACVRSGMKQWATLLEKMPEEFAKAEAGEKRVRDAIGGKHTIINLRRKGHKRGITLEEFRHMYVAGEIKVEPFDYGGCGCFVDDAA
jgi:hypothetical protein